MKIQKLLAFLLSAVLILCFFAGCSSSSYNGDAGYPNDKGTVSENLSGSGNSTQNAAPANRKLIRKMWLEAQTYELDTLLAATEQQITQLGGYVEAKNVYHGSASSYRSRNASLTVRIPVEKMDSFAAQVAGASNIVSQKETTEDVTLSYIATQSRLTALETEQTRLLELLAEAQNMTEILSIEAKLTDVRTELEKVTSQLRLYDNLVDYGTIYLTLQEVQEYTEPEPENFWERIASGFTKSLRDLGNGFAEFFAFLVIGSPYLVLLAAVVTGVLLIVRFATKKKKYTPPSNNVPWTPPESPSDNKQ